MERKFVDVLLVSALFVIGSCFERNLIPAIAFTALGFTSCLLLKWSKIAAKIVLIAFSVVVAILPQFNSISVMIFLLVVPALLSAGGSIRLAIGSGLLIWIAGSVEFANGLKFERLNSGDLVAAVLLVISVLAGQLIAFFRKDAQRKSLELDVLQRFLNEDLAEELHNSVASSLSRASFELERLSSIGTIAKSEMQPVLRELRAAEMSVRDLLDLQGSPRGNRRPKNTLRGLHGEVSEMLLRSGFRVEPRFENIPLEEVVVPNPISAIVRECALNIQKYGDKAEVVECGGALVKDGIKLYWRNAPKSETDVRLNSGVGLIIANRLAESCSSTFTSGPTNEGRWHAEVIFPMKVRAMDG